MDDNEEKVVDKQSPKKKKSILRRLFKVVLYFILAIIGINILLCILLSIPAVQDKVTGLVVKELKSKLNTEISIDKLRLHLLNRVSVTIDGVYVEDQAQDTLLYTDHLGVMLDPWRLLKSEIRVTGISLDNFFINVNQKDSISDFNFQFIIDAFAGDTAVADTSRSSLAIVIRDVDIKGGRLRYDILSEPYTPGVFNASHIALYDFEANLDLNSIDPENLDISLNKLQAKEQSGLILESLKGDVFSKRKRYWAEGLVLKLPSSVLSLENASYDMETKDFVLRTKDVRISPSDLYAFMPELKTLTKDLALEADVSGELPYVGVNTFNLSYGDEAVLEAHASMSDALNYLQSNIELSIDKFRISPKAITAFAGIGDSAFVLPDMLSKTGNISLKGKLEGRLNKFSLNMESWFKQGAINLTAMGGTDTTFTNFRVDAKLNTQNFNLGNLLDNDSLLGRMSMHVDIAASQKGEGTLSAQLKGAIDKAQYAKIIIHNVPFSAYYNPKEMGFGLDADLPVGVLTAEGSMTQEKIPDIRFNMVLDTLHVDSFYKNEEWMAPRLSFRIDGELKGAGIDNMTGKVIIDSLDFHDKNFNFKPGQISLISGKSNNNSKYIYLNSSLLSAGLSGKYNFTTVGAELNNMMNSYLPAIFPTRMRVNKYENVFSFNLSVRNTEQIGQILALPADIIKSGEIDGHIDAIEKQMDIRANFPHIRFGETDILNIKGDVSNRDSAFHIVASTDLPMTKGNYGLSLNIEGANNSLHGLLDLNSKGTQVNLNGKLETLAKFSLDDKKALVSTLNILPSGINIDKFQMKVLPAIIINKGEITTIENFGIGLEDKRYFGIDGVLSEQKTDTLNIYFDKAQIGDLLSAFEVDHVKAMFDGNIYLSGVLGQPDLLTDNFKIEDIVIFGDTLGTFKLRSTWSDALGAVKLNSTLVRQNNEFAHIDGVVYTRQDSLDMRLKMDRLPINWLSPFMAGTLNQLSGSISSDITAVGKMSAPNMTGFLGFNDIDVGIDYTNVTYHISDTINVSPDKIGFNNLTLKDQNNNTARVNALVTHKNFKDMKYLLDMRMDNLMVLNTESRVDSLFFGRVFASGRVRINGDDSNINMDMNVKNGKNSIINISIPQKSEAVDYRSVVYINVPPEKLENEKKDVSASIPLPLQLNANIDLDQSIALRVVIDPTTGDIMQVKGQGKVIFSYNMQTEEMKAFGDYTIEEGSVKVSLQGLKTLEFKVRDGSKLNFIGDPLKTRFNITAYRRVKADLKTLDPSFSPDGSRNPQPVDCVLGIKGNMDQMELTYNVELPDADDDTKRKLQALIATDEQKIRQFAYLIATNSFYSNTGGGGNITDGMWTSLASSTLSSGLNAIFGGILGDKWQVGTNIESNDGSFSDMNMSVSVSTKLFDDRLKLNTNVGYRSDQTTNNSFIGDFEAEYELTPVWTLKAYNHTNDRFYKQAPTTQGIGIVYTKEASSLKRLFSSFKSRKKRARQETTEVKQSGTGKGRTVPNTEK